MIERWIAASAAYLGSVKARESLARDPYWPKWDSPWWHMALLHELGRADAIPRAAAEEMLAALDAKYLRFFPNAREPLPSGKDQVRDAACHCGLATMHRVLEACGLDLEARAPWMRAWFLRYQLPDGGLNCDERAYEKGTASSIQSTVPVLEALVRTPRRLTPIEEDFLDRGAEYLIERRLVRRRRDGRVMDESFLMIGFPRFYGYDVLRGLAFLADWSRVRGKKVPRAAVDEALSALAARFPDGRVRVEKEFLPDSVTFRPDADGRWSGGHPVATFPLLESARRVGAASDVLSRQWAQARAGLGAR